MRVWREDGIQAYHIDKGLVCVEESLKVDVYKGKNGVNELNDNDVVMILSLINH